KTMAASASLIVMNLSPRSAKTRTDKSHRPRLLTQYARQQKTAGTRNHAYGRRVMPGCPDR
ncbi:hypothetical protein MXD81_08895, partial [Microbacteriaceae bacterium K1510]|nr:hypothetical protein [Microbacteriaceae bacterium K1510]